MSDKNHNIKPLTWFTINTEPKGQKQFIEGRCDKCHYYEGEQKLCRKYRMTSEPEQSCKAFMHRRS